ncbi:MAG: LysM peptidoglycan-binding domain-containing protein [bacterium]|nr:LysM peptidoglycan-binding domain-containing protein [bacterium]
MKEEVVDTKGEENSPSEIVQNNIMNSINADETYVKYHVHTVMQSDTLEGILDKYKITLTELKKYNSFEALEVNMKLVIPENEEN